MPRDSQSVALEFMDLVRRTAANPDHCRSLLAVKLEMIYDFAYASGYKAGKDFAREHAYDQGFAEGCHIAQSSLHPALPAPIPAASAPPKNNDTHHQSLTPKAPGKRLFGLPCDVCGALTIDNECQVCTSRGASRALSDSPERLQLLLEGGAPAPGWRCSQ